MQYNVETSWIGHGVFSVGDDAHYIKCYKLSPRAVSSGSDLRAITPREALGIFVGLRARHMQDSGNLTEAAKDYLLARYLFPTNHQLFFKGTGATLLRAAEMFASDEEGYPLYWVDCMEQLFGGNRRVFRKSLRQSLGSEIVGAGYTFEV